MHDYLNIHQKKCVEALLYLDQICKEYNITFFLIEGSALGAVRHKGFIPWDDDIDIGLKYDEWIKLREILKTNEVLPSKGFNYLDRDVDVNYPRMQPKIISNGRNCIDIFLLSKWIDNHYIGILKKRLITEEINLFWRCLNYKRKYRPEESRIKKVLAFILGIPRIIVYRLYKIGHTYNDIVDVLRNNEAGLENDNSGEWYINLYGAYSEKRERIKGEWMSYTSYIEFEGKVYPTIGKTDKYLTNLYGDYMKLPPESERKNAHSEKF